MSHCIDSKFGRYAKDKWTQLQWRFQKVEKSDNFPLGVKTTYRAYCRDEVFLINTDDTKDCAFSCHNAKVRWFPQASETEPEGMYLLQSLPSGEILPEEFIPDSRKIVDDVLKKVISMYTPQVYNAKNSERKRNYCHDIVDEWKHFADHLAPASDSASEYCETHPLYIPLSQELFSIGDDNTILTVNNRMDERDIPIDVLFQDSVQWSRRGVKRSTKHPANTGATIGSDVGSKKTKPCFDLDSDSGNNDNDSESTCSSEENNCVYTGLNQRQQIKYGSIIQKYCGKTFRDTEDSDNIDSIYEGLVTDLVFEKNLKHFVFHFKTRLQSQNKQVCSIDNSTKRALSSRSNK